jgi:hypothetical protein
VFGHSLLHSSFPPNTLTEPVKTNNISLNEEIVPVTKKSSKKAIELNYLVESDVSISKPVIIKDLTKVASPSKTKRIKKNKYEEINYETDPEDYKKIDEVVKKTVRSDELKKSQSNNDKKAKDEEIEKTFFGKSPKRSSRDKDKM